MLDRLTGRERRLILGLGIFVIFLGFLAIIQVAITYKNEVTDEIYQSRSDINTLEKLVREYQYYQTLQIGGSEEDVSQMYSKLDQIMIRYGLKEKVLSMKDSATVIRKDYNKLTIDVSFRSVNLQDIFKLIYDIEKNNQIQGKVDYLTFRKPFIEKEVYDVNIKISSYNRISKK